jgi:hypothetical protein
MNIASNLCLRQAQNEPSESDPELFGIIGLLKAGRFCQSL